MKNISFILLFCLTSFYSLAQRENSDSLKLVMERYKKMDTVQINNIKNYAYSIANSDPAKSKKYFSQGLQLAKDINYQEGIVKMYIGQANIEADAEEYDAAAAIFLQALQFAEKNRLTKTYYSLNSDLSEMYRFLRDEERTRYHAQKALSLAEAEKNDYKIAKAAILLGSYYMVIGQWSKSEPLFKRAKNIAIRLKDKNLEIKINSYAVYQLTKEKKYDEAISIYRQDLLYRKKTDDKARIAWDYVQMSNIFAKKNSKDSAYHYANKALKTAQDNKLVKELRDAYDAMFKSRYKFGEYKEALQNRIIFDSLRLIAFDANSGKIANKTRIEIEQSQKDAIAKTELLKREKKIAEERNLMYFIIVIISLILLFLFWNNRQKQKAKQKIEEAFAKLKATQTQLIQSEKMASLGELTAGIAHEIQNPLNFVNNFSEVSNEMILEIIEERAKKQEDRDEALQDEILDDISKNLEKINHHGKRADAIVKGMLQHSRSSSGKKELTDLNALCDEYLRLSYHGLRAKDKTFNATMKTDFDTSIGKINIIPQDFGRVVLNLINNAFYVVNEKNQLNINNYEPTISITTKKENNKIIIEVTDNGNGMPSAIMDKVFQPFFTTKPTGQGTGLGLSLSYDIITKAHGGELKVTSIENEGTTFSITIPN
jgi:signal transduction histidine kinase